MMTITIVSLSPKKTAVWCFSVVFSFLTWNPPSEGIQNSPYVPWSKLHGVTTQGTPRGIWERFSLVYSCYIIGICAFIQLQLEMSLMVVGLTSSTVAVSPHPLPTEMLLNGRCWRAGIAALVLLPTFPSVSAGFEWNTLCDVLLGGHGLVLLSWKGWHVSSCHSSTFWV